MDFILNQFVMFWAWAYDGSFFTSFIHLWVSIGCVEYFFIIWGWEYVMPDDLRAIYRRRRADKQRELGFIGWIVRRYALGIPLGLLFTIVTWPMAREIFAKSIRSYNGKDDV